MGGRWVGGWVRWSWVWGVLADGCWILVVDAVRKSARKGTRTKHALLRLLVERILADLPKPERDAIVSAIVQAPTEEQQLEQQIDGNIEGCLEASCSGACELRCVIRYGTVAGWPCAHPI